MEYRGGKESHKSQYPSPSLLVAGVEGKKNRALTQAVFHRLLNWFNEEHGDQDSGGQMYEEMRQKLISYFDRRGCRFPEDLADETLNRVAQRLDEKGSITNVTPAQFCYIKARQVLHEYWRRPEQKEIALEDLPVNDQPDQRTFLGNNPNDEQDEQEKWMECLEDCLQKLKPQDHELIIKYYYGAEPAAFYQGIFQAGRRHAEAVRSCATFSTGR